MIYTLKRERLLFLRGIFFDTFEKILRYLSNINENNELGVSIKFVHCHLLTKLHKFLSVCF